MSLTRRAFLRKLWLGAAALPIAAELDWERLLWVPKPIITVPGSMLDEINAIAIAHIMPAIEDDFFKSVPLLEYLKRRNRFPVASPLIQENFSWR